jgi:very-short-patch-repair endonuclease
MTEQIEAWWSRRQRSKGVDVPYPIGDYRADWERYGVLVRQYHPDLNHGIALTQIPPAADVYLVWECDSGHRFVATPTEQRQRPGQSRRRSTWCPDCAAAADPKRPRAKSVVAAAAAGRAQLTSLESPLTSASLPPWPNVRPAPSTAPRRPVKLCATSTAEKFAVGEAYRSACAPVPASAAEALLRQKLTARLEFAPGLNAIRVERPFFTHLEVWPDIVLSDLRVAIEYDTTGREGVEHVGRREDVDRRKDRMLRAAGWEVIRIRCGKLQPLGAHDIAASGVTAKLIDRVLDELRVIRGDLIVNCYLV